MFQELMINGVVVPRPDEALVFSSEKLKTEYETEAGTTQVNVRRDSRLSIKGSWTLTGSWMEQFREWVLEDVVKVSCFFPKKDEMSDHICQLAIKSEKHVRNAREQLSTWVLYQISVEMEEL